MTIQLLAVDLGKRSFHMHGITADGVVVSRKVSRSKFEAAGREIRLVNPRYERRAATG